MYFKVFLGWNVIFVTSPCWRFTLRNQCYCSFYLYFFLRWGSEGEETIGWQYERSKQEDVSSLKLKDWLEYFVEDNSDVGLTVLYRFIVLILPLTRSYISLNVVFCYSLFAVVFWVLSWHFKVIFHCLIWFNLFIILFIILDYVWYLILSILRCFASEVRSHFEVTAPIFFHIRVLHLLAVNPYFCSISKVCFVTVA